MRKNAFRTFAAALVIGACLTIPAFADSATVTGNDVNVRSGPGQGFPVVDCLPRGYTVNVTDLSDGSWYEVEYNGMSGFMSAGYLSVQHEDHSNTVTQTPEPQEPAPNSTRTIVACINAMFVRFRSGPGTGYSILGEYNTGKPVSLSGVSGEWIACVIDGQAGFVHENYINVSFAEEETVQQAPVGPTAVQTVQPSPEPSVQPTAAPVAYPAATVDPYADGAASYYVPESYVPVSATPMPTPEPTPTPAAAQTPVNSQTAAPQASTQEAQISGNYVRFRSGPSTGYPILNTYNNGKTLTVTGVYEDWTACIIDGQSGYVFSSYVSYPAPEPVKPVESVTEQQPQLQAPAQGAVGTNALRANGYISGNNVRLRDDCNMSSNVIAELFYGNPVEIRWYEGDWTAIMYNGEIGYVYSKYVKEGSLTATTAPTEPAVQGESQTTVVQPVNSAELGAQIANYALQYLGYNYCWGGASPETGFDCSGLVYYTYSQFGYVLNRVAADQATNGYHVDELQPGDILCFYSGGSYIGHVGIYIGDNMFVHAANSATGVIISDLSGNYGARGYEARRIVG